MAKGDLTDHRTTIVATPEIIDIWSTLDDGGPSGMAGIITELITVKGKPKKAGQKSWKLKEEIRFLGLNYGEYERLLGQMHALGMIRAQGIPGRGGWGKPTGPSTFGYNSIREAMRWAEETQYNEPNKGIFLDEMRRVHRKLGRSSFRGESSLTVRDKDVLYGLVEGYDDSGVDPTVSGFAIEEARMLGVYRG